MNADTYQIPTLAQRAGATRSQRHAAGKYVSRAQKAAFIKSLARGGDAILTREEKQLLATHPHLAPSQRQRYAELAQAQAA